MQILTRTYMAVIEDFDHNGEKYELDETNTSIVKIEILNLRAPFCTSTFTLKKIAFLDVHNRESITPLPYEQCCLK